MIGRNFLSLLASLPAMGWLKPKAAKVESWCKLGISYDPNSKPGKVTPLSPLWFRSDDYDPKGFTARKVGYAEVCVNGENWGMVITEYTPVGRHSLKFSGDCIDSAMLYSLADRECFMELDPDNRIISVVVQSKHEIDLWEHQRQLIEKYNLPELNDIVYFPAT